MHANKFLHNILVKSSVIKHKARLKSVLSAVETVAKEGQLGLSRIGRHMLGTAKVRNKIKKTDYLLNNGMLRTERQNIYNAFSRYLLANLNIAMILIDWSPCLRRVNQILRASIVLRGRSMTLYEEVHHESKLMNAAIHESFLKKLKTFIPEECRVIIITDAGFLTNWFKMISTFGWDYLGRVRSKMLFCRENEDIWQSCISEYKYATNTPEYRGQITLAKSNKLTCHMYLYCDKEYKAPKKKMRTEIKAHRRAAYEPWLLVTSLSPEEIGAINAVGLYRKRMKIEQEFRNTKEQQWGVGMCVSRSTDIGRLQILLLIGYLAIFILWLIGLTGEKNKRHFDYQANSIKSHRVISLVFLGRQILKHEPNKIRLQDLRNAVEWGKSEFNCSNFVGIN